MKLRLYNQAKRPALAGFTMVELALCIAVVAIAMVAIIGILPTGLTVQKQNREEAQITQDAQTLLNAIRGGASTMDELTNFVDWIEVSRSGPTVNNFHLSGVHDPYGAPGNLFLSGLWDGSRILGLISRPKYEGFTFRSVFYIETNSVAMYLRPFSGPVTDRAFHDAGTFHPPTSGQLDFGFRYKATIEVNTVYPEFFRVPKPYSPTNQPASTLSDVRLTLQWPVIIAGNKNNLKVKLGPNTRTYRAQIAGVPEKFPWITNLTDLTIFATNAASAPSSYPLYLYRFRPEAL